MKRKFLILAGGLLLSAGCQMRHNTATADTAAHAARIGAIEAIHQTAVDSMQREARAALRGHATRYLAELLERQRSQLMVARNEPRPAHASPMDR